MKKSTLIATCLFNSNFFRELEEAESAVFKEFKRHYPDLNFNRWNKELHDDYAKDIIKNVGRASSINVKNFIKDLSK
ncbi:MAG: hypothetical protein RIC06_25740 [Cyclobacteriaceae bacterium]